MSEKLNAGDVVIGIVGLGYVGLPLLIGFASKGCRVVGFDVDPSKVEGINEGRSYIDHISSDSIAEHRNSGRVEATDDFSKIAGVDAVLICVPTPLDEHYEPDLQYVTTTLESIRHYLQKGQLISLESTTYPRTTKDVMVPILEEGGGTAGVDFHVVYSPEREDPGNKQFTAAQIPKLIGGVTPSCLDRGVAIYEILFEKVIPVSAPEVAEFAKLLENIYRAVNIGLVNEMKVVAQCMDVDIWEVINAAATKPFGFTAFYPGPGLGGHCIPIDPFYLTWKAREYGIHTRFIELAGEINRGMPDYVIDRTMRALNQAGRAVNGSKICVVGLAYKPNVDDMRESPSFDLLDKLVELGAEVSYSDPYIPCITPTREHADHTGMKSVEWSATGFKDVDCAIIATRHDNVDLEEILDWVPVVVDTRNALSKEAVKASASLVAKA